MAFFTTSETLNFKIWSIWDLTEAQIYLKYNSEPLKLSKMTILRRLNLPKFDLTPNMSDGKIIKFQQSQALTSHFESFWNIVDFKPT